MYVLRLQCYDVVEIALEKDMDLPIGHIIFINDSIPLGQSIALFGPKKLQIKGLFLWCDKTSLFSNKLFYMWYSLHWGTYGRK